MPIVVPPIVITVVMPVIVIRVVMPSVVIASSVIISRSWRRKKTGNTEHDSKQ